MTDESVHFEEAEPSPQSGNWLVWVVVLAVLASAAVGYRWMLGGANSGDEAANGGTVKSVLPLETFVVNLADPNEKAYLRIGMSLGLDHPMPSKDVMPVASLRDSILAVLASSKPDDLLTAEGKLKLKEDLLHAVQSRSPQLGVREIYFTEFLIQR